MRPRECLVAQIGDLRSAIVGEVCKLLPALAEQMGAGTLATIVGYDPESVSRSVTIARGSLAGAKSLPALKALLESEQAFRRGAWDSAQAADDRAIELGASPRASIALLKSAQVIAASASRDFVTPDDVKPMTMAVLRHRIMLHPDAQLQGVTADDRIADILKTAPVPRVAA